MRLLISLELYITKSLVITYLYYPFLRNLRGFYPKLGQLFPFWDKVEGQKSNNSHKTLHHVQTKKGENEGISRQNTNNLTSIV